MTERMIQEVRSAQPSRDGDGVAINRISGMRHAAMDPILMLDELYSDNRNDFSGGFPPHPHRGMQTLTYMLRGGLIHEDSQGNRGEIRNGGAQWMSAGRGVIHSEMPTGDTTGMQGFQLWFNLRAAEKMSEPAYRDVAAEELAARELACGRVVAIAGTWFVQGEPLEGPLQGLSADSGVLDVELRPGAELPLSGLEGRNVLVYVYEGSWDSSRGLIDVRSMAITGAGDNLVLTAGAGGLRALTLSGKPIGEAVVNYGPFVMNSQEEIEQAMNDYRSGVLGA